MKKALFFALALIAVGCADPIPRNVDTLVEQGDVLLDRETMRPYTGPIFELFSDDDSKVGSRGTLRDGRPHGIAEEYHRNGTLQWRMSFNNGEADGIQERFNEFGQSMIKWVWEDGEMYAPDGPFERYYENGQLQTKGTLVNGKQHIEHGPWEDYFNDGSLSRKGTYNMSERCGKWIVSDGGNSPINTRTYDRCPPGLEDGN